MGDNSAILPTDTMKNTVYSRARESKAECIEDFALELCEFFLSRNPQVERVAINIASTAWEHALVQGKPHPSTFVRGSQRSANHGCYVCPGWQGRRSRRASKTW